MKNKYHTCKLNHSWFCFIAQASSFYHMIHWFLQKNDIYFYCLLLCYEGASAHFVSVCVFNQINVVTEYSVCRDCHHTSQIWKFCQPTTSEKTSFISFWRFWLSLFYCTIKASVFWMLDPLFWQNFWFLICMYVIGVYIHDTVKFMMLHYFMAWCWMWIAFYIILLKILKTSTCKIIPYCVHVLVKGSIFIYRYFIKYVRMASLR